MLSLSCIAIGIRQQKILYKCDLTDGTKKFFFGSDKLNKLR